MFRPAADGDLDEQAAYYSVSATAALGHRFLVAAHDTFALLANQPYMGWHPALWHPELRELRVFRVRTFERMLILYLPLRDGVDILRVVHGSRDMQAFVRREGL